MANDSFDFTAGLLVRAPVRRFLDECQFYGHLESYKELRGWLGSRFLIRGMSPSARNQLLAWASTLDAKPETQH